MCIENTEKPAGCMCEKPGMFGRRQIPSHPPIRRDNVLLASRYSRMTLLHLPQICHGVFDLRLFPQWHTTQQQQQRTLHNGMCLR